MARATLKLVTGLAQKILEEARALTPDERRRVALELLDEPDEVEAPEVVERAWGEELERRVGQVDAGSAKLIPASEVISTLQARAPRR